MTGGSTELGGASMVSVDARDILTDLLHKTAKWFGDRIEGALLTYHGGENPPWWGRQCGPQ